MYIVLQLRDCGYRYQKLLIDPSKQLHKILHETVLFVDQYIHIFIYTYMCIYFNIFSRKPTFSKDYFSLQGPCYLNLSHFNKFYQKLKIASLTAHQTLYKLFFSFSGKTFSVILPRKTQFVQKIPLQDNCIIYVLFESSKSNAGVLLLDYDK